jgi:hypothetical protein
VSVEDMEAMKKLADYLALDRTTQTSIPWNGGIDCLSLEEDKASTVALLPTQYIVGEGEGLSLENELNVDFDIHCLGAKMLTVDSEWVEAVIAIHKIKYDREAMAGAEDLFGPVLARLMKRYPDVGTVNSEILLAASLERVFRGRRIRVDVYSTLHYHEMVINYESDKGSGIMASSSPWVVV